MVPRKADSANQNKSISGQTFLSGNWYKTVSIIGQKYPVIDTESNTGHVCLVIDNPVIDNPVIDNPVINTDFLSYQLEDIRYRRYHCINTVIYNQQV